MGFWDLLSRKRRAFGWQKVHLPFPQEHIVLVLFRCLTFLNNIETRYAFTLPSHSTGYPSAAEGQKSHFKQSLGIIIENSVLWVVHRG